MRHELSQPNKPNVLRVFKQYYPARNFFFALGEGLFLFASVLAAAWIIMGASALRLGSPWIPLKGLLVTIVCQSCLYYNDLYDLNITDSFQELTVRLLRALGGAAIVLGVIYFVFPGSIIGSTIYFINVGIAIALIFIWRVGYNFILERGMFNQKIMVLGSNRLAENIIAEIAGKKNCGYDVTIVVPEINDNRVFSNKLIKAGIIKKDYNGLCDHATELGIRTVVVALSEKRDFFPVKELLKCRISGIDIMEGASFYEMLTGKLLVEQISPGWLIFSEGFQKSFRLKLFKRSADIMFSLVMLVLLLPLMAVVAVLIKLESKGPVFFSQERVGENRVPYRVHKFRSMRSDAEKHTGPVWARSDDDRVTRVGRFIRKWRVDEIPQLWNVLKGEMSFVGPRPERAYFVEQLEAEIPFYAERFTVKPGLSGWAQVSYRYGASVEDAVEKLNYDLFYIKNMSFLMDMMIVFKTVKTVLFGEGAR